MKVEFPVLRRCCCCLPLRLGLIVWGYIKLVMAVIQMVLMVVGAYNTFYGLYFDEVILIVMMCTTAAEMTFNVVLIVGGHRKDPRLLKVYEYYSATGVGICIILAIICFSFTVLTALDGDLGTIFLTPLFMGMTGVLLLSIVVQFYLMLLVRSEVIKLRSKERLEFVNKTIETADRDTTTVVLDQDTPEKTGHTDNHIVQ